MRLATLFRLGLQVSLLTTVASCGSGDSNVVVDVSNLPARATKLTVQATLDGKPAMSSVDISAPLDRFGFTLPASNSGHLVLNATAYDSDGCTDGTGMGPGDLPGSLITVSLAVTPQSPRQCGTLSPCAAGVLCSYTPKPQNQDLSNLWAISPTNIWAVGGNGTIVHYDGSTWSLSLSNTSTALYGVWASGPSDVWVVGAGAKLLHYDGMRFTATANPASTSNDLNSVFGTGPNDVWVVGGDPIAGTAQELLHWDGSTWKKISSGTSSELLGIWASSPTDIYASGITGLMLHSTNGSTFSSMSTPVSVDLLAVWGLSAQQIFSVGASGTIIKSDGTSWKRASAGTISNLNAIFGDGTTVYAAGNNGTVVESTAPFTTFTGQSTGTVTTLYGIQPGANGIGWVVGQNGYIGHFDARP